MTSALRKRCEKAAMTIALPYCDDVSPTLKGLRVVEAQVSIDKTLVRLQDAEGRVVWLSAVGDCCSNSWFEHIDGMAPPFTLTEEPEFDRWMEPKKEVRDWNNPDDSGKDVLKIYAIKFKTNRGRASLELRNASNGYYGGTVEVSEEQPIDQYSRKIEKLPKMRPLVDDF